MYSQTKVRIHNVTAKETVKCGSGTWVLNKRDEQRLGAAQMRFLRPLLDYTKLDRKKMSI
jgi:hypothetical protein